MESVVEFVVNEIVNETDPEEIQGDKDSLAYNVIFAAATDLAKSMDNALHDREFYEVGAKNGGAGTEHINYDTYNEKISKKAHKIMGDIKISTTDGIYNRLWDGIVINPNNMFRCMAILKRRFKDEVEKIKPYIKIKSEKYKKMKAKVDKKAATKRRYVRKTPRKTTRRVYSRAPVRRTTTRRRR